LRNHPESASPEPCNKTGQRIAVIEAMRGVAALAVELYRQGKIEMSLSRRISTGRLMCGLC
jgi:hypothetical protein